MNLLRLGRAYIFIFSVLQLAGCASQSSTYQTDVSLSDVVDTDVFADLVQDPHSAEINSVTDGRPFYRAIGNETLARVAYALYGNQDTSVLSTENPSLDAKAKLARGQRVYFIFETLNPRTQLLNKDMLKRYGEDLAKVLRAKTEQLSNTRVGAGESLQSISKRLYGSTRYWTELYLFNIHKISNYDVIKAGTDLEFFPRVQIAKSEPQAVVAQEVTQVSEATVQPLPIEKTEPVQAPVPVEVAPVVQEAKVETAPIVVEEAAPPVIAATPPVIEAKEYKPIKLKPVQQSVEEDLLSAKNLRRLMYGLVVLLVLFSVQMLTRQRQAKPPRAPIVASKASVPRVGVPLPANLLKRVSEEDKNNAS
jgi:hypothetical protein